jgi:YegS/Rv2252/BmrU family lipid kinase
MKRAITLVNKSGGSFTEGIAERIGEALAAAGVDSEIVLVEGKDCAARAADHVKKGVELIIAAGGDGTMGSVAGELAGSKAVMGIMPLGTLNHFARDLGIPFDIAEAAKVIAQAKTRKVDIAEVNGHTFINNASIGLYPLMVMDRDGQRKRLGRSKRLAMLVASLRTMARFHSRRLTLSTDGGEAKVDTPLLFVGNNDYQVALPSAGRREALDDGELCVMVMRSKSLPGFLAAIGRALIGIKRREEMVRVSGVKELKVDSPRSHLSVAMDGETVSLKPPLVFRIRPGALNVIAPA